MKCRNCQQEVSNQFSHWAKLGRYEGFTCSATGEGEKCPLCGVTGWIDSLPGNWFNCRACKQMFDFNGKTRATINSNPEGPANPGKKPNSIWLVEYECRDEVVRISADGKGFFAPGQEPCWDLSAAKWIREIVPESAANLSSEDDMEKAWNIYLNSAHKTLSHIISESPRTWTRDAFVACYAHLQQQLAALTKDRYEARQIAVQNDENATRLMEQLAAKDAEIKRQGFVYDVLYDRFQENERIRRQMQRQGEELSEQCDRLVAGHQETLEAHKNEVATRGEMSTALHEIAAHALDLTLTAITTDMQEVELQQRAYVTHRILLKYRQQYDLRSRGEIEKGCRDGALDNPNVRTVASSSSQQIDRLKEELKTLGSACDKIRSNASAEIGEYIKRNDSLRTEKARLVKERDAYREGCDSAKRGANEWYGKWQLNETEKINLRSERDELKKDSERQER